jgi:protein-S-isoprenylcysteine O-methyltransferase Ste14
MITYENIILGCWATFLLVWIVSAFNTKRDIRGGYGKVWQEFWLLRLVAAVVFLFVETRIARGTAHFTNPELLFSRGIFPQSAVLGWAAAVLSVIGVGFAIWARVHLGRNWSPRPAVKEHHELITTGPYAYVRHPIYTGLILMALGMALTGSIWGIGVFIIASFTLILRIGKEEKIMLELFPNEYSEYQKRTKRLVPFVW